MKKRTALLAAIALLAAGLNSPGQKNPASPSDTTAPVAATETEAENDQPQPSPVAPETRALPAPAAPAPPVAAPTAPVPPKPVKLAQPPPPPAEPGMENEAEEPFAAGLVDEERDLDLPKAIKRYQAELAKFDEQRARAAQSVFRLGECYRKLGKTKAAQAQYERILRDFSDQKALAQASLRQVPQLAPVAIQLRKPRPRVNVNTDTFHPAAPMKNLEANWERADKLADEAAMDEVEENADQDIPALKKSRDLAELNAKFEVQPQPALRQLQQQMKKLQEQLDTLRQSKTLFKLPSEAQQQLEDARTEMELAKVNVRNAAKQAKEASKIMDAIKNSQPLYLPPPADADPKYAEIRNQIIQLSTASPSKTDEALRKRLEELEENLRQYVEGIYRPTVASSIKFAAEQYDKALREADETRARYEELKKTLEKQVLALKRAQPKSVPVETAEPEDPTQ